LSRAANRIAVIAPDGENPFTKNDRVADRGGIAIIRNLPHPGVDQAESSSASSAG
jgi:hypothetical protein